MAECTSCGEEDDFICDSCVEGEYASHSELEELKDKIRRLEYRIMGLE